MSLEPDPLLSRVAAAIQPESASIERVRRNASAPGRRARRSEPVLLAAALGFALAVLLGVTVLRRNESVPSLSSTRIVNQGAVVGVRSERGVWIVSEPANERTPSRRMIAVAP